VAARYILAALAVVFVVSAVLRLLRDGGHLTTASKTWLLVGIIFAGVSFWLWIQ